MPLLFSQSLSTYSLYQPFESVASSCLNEMLYKHGLVSHAKQKKKEKSIIVFKTNSLILSLAASLHKEF